MGQVSVTLLVVHSVADHKHVRNLEPPIGDWQIDKAAHRLIQQRAYFESGRPMLSEHPKQIIGCQACVDNIFDQKHVAARDTLFEVLRDSHDAGSRLASVTGDCHEVYCDRSLNGSEEICGEDERSFQDRDYGKVFSLIRLRDFASEL